MVNDIKERTLTWIENHKKGVLIAMVVILFFSLLMLIIGQFNRKQKTEDDPIKRFKETTQKVGKNTKTSYGAIADVNELYQTSKAIMQKDSLTKEDIAYLRMADSTLTSIIKTR